MNLNSSLVAAVAFVVLTFHARTPCHAEKRGERIRLIEQTYRDPTEEEIQRFRDSLSRLDIEQSIPDRFGYRCEAFIYNDRKPEQFVSIHAVDREMDAVRHVVRRSFTEEDDPRLLFSSATERGYGDDGENNIPGFPIRHDRLRLDDKVYFTNDPTVFRHRDEVKLTGEDRNLNPVTCSLLPLSSFFVGDISKRSLSRVYGIDKVRPTMVSTVGPSFIAKYATQTTNGSPGLFTFIEFVNDLPVTYEMWLMLKDRNHLVFRTTTQWKRVQELHLPLRIEASQTRESNTDILEARFEWKFNEKLPNRLFEVSDVTSRHALDWE